jgi:hypothetical protein
MRTAFRLLFVLFLASPAFAAKVTVLNNDTGTNGFNDPTVAFPHGGNTGTTRGQQRLIAVQAAMDKWGALLNSDVEILIDAAFSSSSFGTCSGDSATLAFAGTTQWFFNFDNAPRRDVLYPVALANKLAKRDLLPPPDGSPPGPTNADIRIRFNNQIDLPNCLGASSWYYGLDGNSGTDVDLIATAMHELAHGLGFSGNIDALTGRFRFPTSLPAIHDTHILDNSAGLRWDQMTAEQRTLSAVNDQNVVFDGPSTSTAAKDYLPTPVMSITAPSTIAKRYSIGHTAGWGAPITIAGVTGALAAAVDVAEPAGARPDGEPLIAGTTSDGCSPFTNRSEVLGKFVLIDRGRCFFVEKAQNAIEAGAIGVIIANNVEVQLGVMGGVSARLQIPVVSISKADGAAIRGALGAGVSLTLFADPQQLSGADVAGHVKLYMPASVESGSSVYHFDVSATPDLLMEPRINSGLPHTGDLTVNHMADLGWASSDSNPVEPDVPPTGRRVIKRGRR